VQLPTGDRRWFRADVVQVIDSKIEEKALPTEPTEKVIAQFDFLNAASLTQDLVGALG
jgi:hypothetical protein